MFAIFMLMAMAVIMLPLAASAQTYTTRRVWRNGRQQTIRVYTTTANRRNYVYNNGYRTGYVSPQERMRLARERNRLYRTENRVARDGVITNREAYRINRQENRYNRRLRRYRNN